MYYVYQLIDPRDGKPFYIGKGQGSRIDQHEFEARNGRQSIKCHRIPEIWEAGKRIEKSIIRYFNDEAEALEFEYQEIDRIGLKNLTNQIPGGGEGFVTPGAGPHSTDLQVVKLLKKVLQFAPDLSTPFTIVVHGIEVEFHEGILKNIRKAVSRLIERKGCDWIVAHLVPSTS
jgi:hypothetical protein